MALGDRLERIGGQTGVPELEADRGEVGGAGHLGDAPIHDVNFAEGADHDVRRLEVAVHDALAMGIGDRLAHPDQDAGRPAQAPALAALAGKAEDLAEFAPADETHRVEASPVRIASHRVNRDDRRVVQLGGDLRLTDEAGDRRADQSRAARSAGGDQFDGDLRSSSTSRAR
ncbi:MAG: hypothetical protein R3F11_19080 [Verrucomicrobiales bacterium]